MLVAELFFDRLGGLLPYVLVILFLTSIPNFAIISPIFYKQLYEHVTVESAVSHKKRWNTASAHPTTSSHHWPSSWGAYWCLFLQFLVSSKQKFPLIIQIGVQLSGSSNGCRPSVLKGGHRSGSPVMIMGLVFISVSKKSEQLTTKCDIIYIMCVLSSIKRSKVWKKVHLELCFIQNKTLSGKLERSDSRRCKKEFGNRCKRQFFIIWLAVLFNLWTGTINFSFCLYFHNQFRIDCPLIIDHHHLHFYRRIVGVSRNWYHVVHALIIIALD